ncbi:2-desacetyl-2-hydroxyethyl bacteriochlorophyllide A dehydrogenase [Orbus hercynius]|uniref:2-desacetyl-2-hydroxyethyl bacteriochlorophyllide A dehydrogenase n=2 Tax=Orbus hercynius TaxID=593135 RepID=A0A495REC8_9GAMM|nr:zinc-binding alcohol dehydrogenase family protein [Orbus hercynius]RKS85711.1 2-desacetyl-2-hydroxyethyl bacteriochlorophyllide A dehydrogenase [Orbus hercynius]
MSNMKYIVIPEPGKVEVKEMEKPVLQKGEAILKVLYGGICGSDMGTYKGTFLYASYPRIPGHEFSAEVVEVGENSHGIKKGMIVTANPYFNCGKCYSCRRGFVNCCTSNQTLGAQRDGIFRQYYSMPIERIYDGKGLDALTLAMIEPFCISYHSVQRTSVKAGDKVLVVGAGPIGLFAVMAAKLKGAEVYVSDMMQNRLDKALEIGAAGVIRTDKEDFAERVKAITSGDGFDVCIECVGLPQTFQNCIDAAAFRGRIGLVGVGKQKLDFAFTQIQTKELDIFGSRNALKKDFIELIDLVKSGGCDVTRIITDVYELNEAEKAFTDMANDPNSRLKSVIKIG